MTDFFLVLITTAGIATAPLAYTEQGCHDAGRVWDAMSPRYAHACVPAPARSLCNQAIPGTSAVISVPCGYAPKPPEREPQEAGSFNCSVDPRQCTPGQRR